MRPNARARPERSAFPLRRRRDRKFSAAPEQRNLCSFRMC
jgi:hypothetical protein